VNRPTVPPLVLLAPGASGGIEALQPHANGLEARGLRVRLVALPRGPAERAVPAYRDAVAAAPAELTVIGGHSFGGRVASLLAAEQGVRGLVLLSYPLHAPGRTEAWDERAAHWAQIGCPVLLLSGEADPFARIELLRRAVRRLPDAELVTYPRIRHGLGQVLDDALDRIADFVHRIT
jgi:predicted alpha/beta-hydrolase family hydrolase